MKVGVVVLNYNVSKETIRVASKLAEFSLINTVIVVDNKSRDEEVEILKQWATPSKVNLFFLEDNGGYAKGNNFGLRILVEQCDSDFCFICNPDIYIEENDFVKIIESFIKCPQYGVLTCCREFSSGEPIRQYWNLPSYKDLVLQCFSLYRKFEKRKNIYSVPNKGVIRIDVAPGAFWGVRSEVLKKVDYLDEQTFLYFEESCFAKKISICGYPEGLVTEAKYITNNEKSSTKIVRKDGRGFRYLLESKDFYMRKYLRPGKLRLMVWKMAYSISLKEYSLVLFIKGQ